MKAPVVLPPRYAPDLEFLGSGGFGTVYRTRDRDRDHDVAVKVPHRGAGAQAAEVTAELQAVARLDHPGVVQVLDVGVDASGQPWLAMECADAGSLASYTTEQPLPWAALRPLLDRLLDALGHAHARGLVHRDLKPDNILLFSQDGVLVPKLADFGLAKIAQRGGDWKSTRLGAGTLLYMPPESFRQDTASIHRTVDLYAFGVLTWVLTSAGRPFRSDDISIVLEKVTEAPQPFLPRPGQGTPPGLGDLLQRLLDGRPERRPALAADVREELERLDGPAAPPIALQRRGPRSAVASQRVPRLRGREALLQRLRDAAREVQSSGRARALRLTGAPGAGRTRLARTLAEELEEQGQTIGLHARFDGEASPDPGLRRAVRTLLGLGSYEGADLRARLVAQAEAGEAPAGGALADWLDPAHGPTMRPADAASRRVTALDALLRQQAARGLAVLHLDQQQPGSGVAELAAGLLGVARAEDYPLLLLLDPADDGDHPGFEILDVPPLPDEALRSILHELLDGDPVVHALVSRAGGSPARAVEAARLWAQRTQRPAPAAAVEPTLQLADLPDLAASATLDIDAVVHARLQGFVASGREARRALLGLVGLLPRPVPRSQLAAGLEAGGLAAGLDAALADAACAGLLREREGCVDVVEAAFAAAAARLAQPRALWSVRAARVLLDADPDPAQRLAAARLLAGAGETAEAATEATSAAQEAARFDLDLALAAWSCAAEALPAGSPQRVALHLGRARTARDAGHLEDAEAMLAPLEAAALPPRQRASLIELRASLRVLRSDPQTGCELAAEASRLYSDLDDAAGTLRADLVHSLGLLWCGDRSAAGRGFERVRTSAAATRHPLEQLNAARRLAHVRLADGDRVGARALYVEALGLSRACGALGHEAVVLRELGNLDLLEDRLDDAESRLREALARFHRTGRRVEIATTRISLGELARRRRDPAEARKEYTAALALTRSFGATGNAAAALVNLALLELGEGKAKAAARRLRAIDRLIERGSGHWLRSHVEALRLTVAMGDADWTGAAEAFELLAESEGELPADPDLLDLLERSATEAGSAGQDGLAADLIDLAVQVAQRLGDRACQARLEALLLA